MLPLNAIEPIFPRLTGTELSVTEKCKGCGKCVEHCYIGAISIRDKRAFINEYCRACGRCASVCPNGAIEIRLSDPEFLEKERERIRSYVKYD